jgi:hypothetical protein
MVTISLHAPVLVGDDGEIDGNATEGSDGESRRCRKTGRSPSRRAPPRRGSAAQCIVLHKPRPTTTLMQHLTSRSAHKYDIHNGSEQDSSPWHWQPWTVHWDRRKGPRGPRQKAKRVSRHGRTTTWLHPSTTPSHDAQRGRPRSWQANSVSEERSEG